MPRLTDCTALDPPTRPTTPRSAHPFPCRELHIVSTSRQHHTPPDDDTLDLGKPLQPNSDEGPDRPLGEPLPAATRHRWHVSLLRPVHGLLIAVCYGGTLATLAWLLAKAITYQDPWIMVFSVWVLIWFGSAALPLCRWLYRRGWTTAERVPVSMPMQLVALVITALNLFLLAYADL
jgi:hypothetical protein